MTKYDIVSRHGSVAYELIDRDYILPAETDNQMVFEIPAETQTASFLEFNYMQTILRNGMDYTLNESRTEITLNGFGLEEGEELVARAIYYQEVPGAIPPRTYNPTGTYRYEIKVEHLDYTATEDYVNIVPVPGFNRKRDEITVVRDNHVLVLGTDYEIDELNQIALADSQILMTGDILHFTIFQGAMADIPPFVVTKDIGESGQHLILDFSYDYLRTGFTAVIELRNELLSVPTIKCLNGPAEPILDPFNMPVTGGYQPGAFLWVTYNERTHSWCSMSHGHYDMSSKYPAYEYAEGDSYFIGNDPSTDRDPEHHWEVTIPHGLHVKPSDIDIRPTEHPGYREDGITPKVIGDIWSTADETNIYVGNTGDATSAFHWSAATSVSNLNLLDAINDAIYYLKTNPGVFETRNAIYEAPENGISEFDIPGYNQRTEKILLINFGQTVLEDGPDYTRSGSTIRLRNIELRAGDIIQIILVKQLDPDYDIPPAP